MHGMPGKDDCYRVGADLARWSDAAEIRALTGTDIPLNKWPEYMGRGRPPVFRWERLAPRDPGGAGCDDETLWWTGLDVGIKEILALKGSRDCNRQRAMVIKSARSRSRPCRPRIMTGSTGLT